MKYIHKSIDMSSNKPLPFISIPTVTHIADDESRKRTNCIETEMYFQLLSKVLGEQQS